MSLEWLEVQIVELEALQAAAEAEGGTLRCSIAEDANISLAKAGLQAAVFPSHLDPISATIALSSDLSLRFMLPPDYPNQPPTLHLGGSFSRCAHVVCAHTHPKTHNGTGLKITPPRTRCVPWGVCRVIPVPQQYCGVCVLPLDIVHLWVPAVASSWPPPSMQRTHAVVNITTKHTPATKAHNKHTQTKHTVFLCWTHDDDDDETLCGTVSSSPGQRMKRCRRCWSRWLHPAQESAACSWSWSAWWLCKQTPSQTSMRSVLHSKAWLLCQRVLLCCAVCSSGAVLYTLMMGWRTCVHATAMTVHTHTQSHTRSLHRQVSSHRQPEQAQEHRCMGA